MKIRVCELRVGDIVMSAEDPESVFGIVGAMSPYGFSYTDRPQRWIPFMGLESGYEFWIDRQVASRDEVVRDLVWILQ